MKKTILNIILLVIVVMGLTTGCNNEKEKTIEDVTDKYGYVEEETVDVLVAKFNKEIMDNSNGEMNPAQEDYLTTDSNRYWYGLVDGIYLVIVPKEFSNDKTKDIVDYMVIYVDKGKKYESDAITYVKYLIKANNSNITANEINKLLEEAKQKSIDKKTSNNGKGISIGYIEKDDNYQYQVIRLYK